MRVASLALFCAPSTAVGRPVMAIFSTSLFCAGNHFGVGRLGVLAAGMDVDMVLSARIGSVVG
jgi:hypothetical protein